MRHGTYAAVHLDLTERATHLGAVVNGWNSPETASRQPGGVGSRGALNLYCPEMRWPSGSHQTFCRIASTEASPDHAERRFTRRCPETETGPAYERPVQLPNETKFPAPCLVLTLIELLGKIVLNPHLPDLVELRLQPVQVLLFILQDRLE